MKRGFFKLTSLCVLLVFFHLFSFRCFAVEQYVGVYENKATGVTSVAVKGKIQDKTGEIITLILVKADTTNDFIDTTSFSGTQIGYIQQQRINENGEYKFLFNFPEFDYDKNGTVNNYKLYMNVCGEVVSPDLVTVTETFVYDLTLTADGEYVQADVCVEDIFQLGQLTPLHTPILAFYAENGSLIQANYYSSTLSKSYLKKIIPEGTAKIKAFVWRTLESLTPLSCAEIGTHYFYVDPQTGNDNNDGSLNSPFQSISKAVQQAKSIDTRSYNNTTIYLREGKHNINDTIVLTSDDFGNSSSRITFKNYPGEKPVVTDGIQIASNEFEKVSGKPYYKFSIPAENGKYPSFRTLLVNGRRAVLARSNDMDDLNVFRSEKESPVFSTMDAHSTNFSNKLYVEPELLQDITTENMGSLELCRYVQWLHQRYEVKSINGIEPQTGYTEVTVNQQQWEYNASQWWIRLQEFTGSPYWFENHLAFLDSPGEFYYDENSGIVYYYPFENEPIENSIIEYSPLKAFFELVGTSDKLVKNISFEGLTFTGLTYHHLNGGLVEAQGNSTAPWDSAAIYGNYTSGISIKNCLFNELGVAGVSLVYKAVNAHISGNVFTNLGLSAIRCAYHQRQPFNDRANGLQIDNNYIENIGTEVQSCNAIWIGRISNVKILHNTIKNVPYSGIAIGWHHNRDEEDIERVNLINVEIAYNHIENTMSVLYDGGGIYTLGSNHEYVPDGEGYNLKVHDNYIYGGLTGTYNDNATSYAHMYNNVVNCADIPFSLQTGSEQSRVSNLLLENCYTISNAISNETINSWNDSFKGRNVTIKNVRHFTNSDSVNDTAAEIINSSGVESEYEQLFSNR